MMLPRAWSAALVQLERDVRMVARRLSGERPAPVVFARSRSPFGREPGRARASMDPRELVVTRVDRETHDVVTIVLEAPRRSAFTFTAGQFFTVLVDIDGETVPRNYSASNAPGSSELHLSIKHKPGGVVSGHLSAVRAGERLRVLGPFGTFGALETPPQGARRLVLLAGGIGMTPLLSIARTVLASEPGTYVFLVYGNRRVDDIAFAGTLGELASAYPGRFEIRHVLEELPAARGFDAECGRLDRGTVARILEAHGIGDADTLLVCGPEGMQDEALAAATALGIGHERVRRERFAIGSSRSGLRYAAPRELAKNEKNDAWRITIVATERLVRTTALAGATLLEAGLAAGAPMRFSCGVGGCGACRVRLVEGEVDLEDPHCLNDEERRSGYVLACVGKPRGACTIEIEREGGGR